MRAEYKSKNFEQLAIVAQVCDGIGLVEAIDKALPPGSPDEAFPCGGCTKLAQRYLRHQIRKAWGIGP